MSHINQQKNSLHSGLESLISTTSVLHKTNLIYKQDDEVEGLYLINSGVVKLVKENNAGEERTVRFCIPGNLIGLEVLREGFAKSDAVVLRTASVSYIPLASIIERANQVELGSLIDRISQSMEQEQSYKTIDRRASAAKRVACFYFEYFKNMKLQDSIDNHFKMLISKREIASFLNLDILVVMQELKQFNKSGLISTHNNMVKIPSVDELRKFAKTSRRLH